ncbi:MAG TPA: hypothetical protein PLU22_24405, partial [Polyangiaceae bacterium]|nr:hypothetical protein [Polyangiaceae bacterium]
GGTATGGTATGGTTTGGTATGGATTGGATTGGTATGGTATGGAESGGAATGGTATGGAESGGAESGGAESGGTTTDGGATTGGVATGGAESGGTAADGGATTGGAATGGELGTGGSSDVVPSSGCGKTPTLTSGTHSIQSRSYILSIPDDYDSSHPYRLVFAFHWNGGTANDIESGGSDAELWSYYGLRNLAENSTIFVAPQGLNNGWANSGGQDLTFVDAMVDQIEGDLCVDTARIFSVGFSYGGGMSYALACDRATVFRAVAVYSGWELSGCSDGTRPIAYLGIHGIGDQTCTIPGGRSLRDTFVGNNGCTPQDPPEPSTGSLTHTCTSYEGCSSGYPVRWCAFDGGHTPGPVDGGGDSGARTWTKGEVWDFFTQF